MAGGKMVKVKLLCAVASNTESWTTGDEYECSEAEAKRFIDAGMAEPIVKAKSKLKAKIKAADNEA